MNLIGARWAILIVRELLLGPKRFTDLQAGLRGAGPNVLAQRLHDLEAVGVVSRRTLPPPAGSRVYEMTEWGAKLGPILAALGDWGLTSPVVPRAGQAGADSLMLGLRSYFNPAALDAQIATCDIGLGPNHFTVRLSNGQLDISRGQPDKADATIQTDPEVFAALLDKSEHLAEAIDERRATVTGDHELLERLLASTSVPTPPSSPRHAAQQP